MNAKQILIATLAVAALVGVPAGVFAQKKAAAKETSERETVAKGMTDRQKRNQEARLRKELETPFKKWMNEDVTYIITDEERAAWKRFTTDEEREQFVEQFWLRRDPTPDTAENEYKEEHYRRIAYANERFASGIPGWKSDRGRIYVTFGPPDEREEHPTGGTYNRPIEEGGGTTTTFPFEKWRYRYIENVGNGTDINIEFVDPTMTGEYRLTMDPSEKDALSRVPGAGLTLYEQMGMANKADRFSRTDGTLLGTGNQPLPARMNVFDRMRQFTDLQKAPNVKFKDLEAAVTSTIRFNLLPVKVRADYMRITDTSVMTNVTALFEKSDLQFQNKEGVAKAVVNIYARITSMSRRVVNVFEDTVTSEVPADLLEQAQRGSSIYQKSIPLAPGRYRLNMVVKDIVGGNMTNYEMALEVPHFEEESLGMSSIVLADMIERVPTRSLGTGQFVIGGSKVRPRMDASFKRNEKMGIYLQLYNFKADEKTNKANATVDYEVTAKGSDKKIFEFSEEVAKVDGASASQYTIEKLLPLQSLDPGEYTLRMKVTDRAANSTLTPTATFRVTE
jgi:GWxTD domain-containing protein